MTDLHSTPTFELMRPNIWHGRMPMGGWIEGKSTLGVTDKATGECIGAIAHGDADAVDTACRTAKDTSEKWKVVSPEDRCGIIRRAARLLDEHRSEAVYWLVRESGSTMFKANFEIDKTIEYLDHAADLVTGPWRTTIADADGFTSYYERQALGVVGVIGPFNFPLVLAMRSVAPAIACGNAVVLKPSDNTAVCGGILLARLFEEAGLPPGVLNVVPGDGTAGNAVVQHDLVSMIAFTGSTKVGRQIGASAGSALKRAALELGGKNPFIVLEDADIELAARAGAFGNFLHQGQICIAVGLHVVHESIAEAYVKRLAELAREMKVGDPWREQVALGPIISEKQRQSIQAFVQDAVNHGANLVEGGTSDGPFYRPTVISNVTDRAKMYRGEVFGPVAPVTTFSDDAEAIRIVNGSDYGLSAGIFGEIEHARRVAAQVQSGMVHINNQPVMADAEAPFGGVKQSGNMTRIGAGSDLDEYTTFRWVTEAPMQYSYELSNF